ncbi:unnamed protein product [Trifolium pratense]|uniref:Uncharacterized protein n=1 Tax=Trifolium pratense TaxID=57577 RepID=A0ACB0LDE5_TRIPR|nr:unnamed protein product [Trifolium pratense]
MMNNKDWRFEQLALITTIFSMLLTIIAVMNISSSYLGKFMAEHDTMVILSLVVLVSFFQIAIFRIIRHHHQLYDYNNNALILGILMLSWITSSIEVSLISYIAAFITLILCCIPLTWFTFVNLHQIPDAMVGIILSFWIMILVVSILIS